MAKKSRSDAGAELAKSLLGMPGVYVDPSLRKSMPGIYDEIEAPLQHVAPVAPDVPEGFDLPGPDDILGSPVESYDLTSSCPDEIKRPATEDPGTRVPAPTDKAPPPLFVVPDGMGGVAPDIVKIVTSVYAIDAHRDYQDLEQTLEVGEERSSYGVLVKHLDKAESRARRAHALYLGAKLELARWEFDSKKVVGAMRARATEKLEAEKSAGDRKKAITNADVEATMADEFPDEWAAQELTRVRLKGVCEHLETLAELWKSRCRTLGTLLSNLRK